MPREMTAGPSPLRLLLRWPAKVAEEILLAPWTVARVRRSLTELPDRIDTLSEALDDTIRMLGETLPEVSSTMTGVARNATHLDEAVSRLASDLTAFRVALEQLLPELSELVSGMDDRVRNVENVVAELGDVLHTVIGSIPGVRRALRDPKLSAGAP